MGRGVRVDKPFLGQNLAPGRDAVTCVWRPCFKLREAGRSMSSTHGHNIESGFGRAPEPFIGNDEPGDRQSIIHVCKRCASSERAQVVLFWAGIEAGGFRGADGRGNF